MSTKSENLEEKRTLALHDLFENLDIHAILGENASVVTSGVWQSSGPDHYTRNMGVDRGEERLKHVVASVNVRFRTGSAELVSAEFDDKDILDILPQEDDTPQPG